MKEEGKGGRSGRGMSGRIGEEGRHVKKRMR